MMPETAELVRYRLARATESLAEAKLLLTNDHVRTAVNRLYYACFYAASALLLTEGHSSPKMDGESDSRVDLRNVGPLPGHDPALVPNSTKVE